jgi:hypothetical protein
MAGQMQWRSTFGYSGAKSLHVRHTPHEPWLPVHQVPGLYNPTEPPVPNSNGFGAVHVLLAQGWQLLDEYGKVVA